MNASRPEISPSRSSSSLKSAGIGTLAFHGVLLLLIWLWPRPPIKPKETLLVVDLTQKTPAPTVEPTAEPTEKPKVIPTEKPTPIPSEKPVPTPIPKLAKETRVVKVNRPLPTAVPVPTPKKTEVIPTPKPQPEPTQKSLPTPPTPAPPKKRANSGADHKTDPTPGPTAPSAPSAAGGGKPGRRFARNDDPATPSSRPEEPSRSYTGAPGRGPREETAAPAGEPDRKRSRGRGGRHKDFDAAPSSAPKSTNNGTEQNVGPSSPGSYSGNSPRHMSGTGGGNENDGPLHSGGLPGATGISNASNTRVGRSDDIAGGTGLGSGWPGSGGQGPRGRRRSGGLLASDPYGTTGNGNGPGQSTGLGIDGPGRGYGSGPGNGTRLAKRMGGDDGDEGGIGRGAGLGDGGPGHGSSGTGPGSARGDDSAEGANGNRTRRRRPDSAHRASEEEDQIGRGIWGGFNMQFFQDKSDHPDLPGPTFGPGHDIDWPVFTQLKSTQKEVPILDNDWGTNPPAPGMKNTFWSMKASARIFVPKDDTYVFSFDELDDAGRLFLDGKQIIEVWMVQKSSPKSGQMFLAKGVHDIRIEYVQGPATAASIKLSWSSTSFLKEIVGVYKPGVAK